MVKLKDNMTLELKNTQAHLERVEARVIKLEGIVDKEGKNNSEEFAEIAVFCKKTKEFKYLEDNGLIKVYSWNYDWKDIKSSSQVQYAVIYKEKFEAIEKKVDGIKLEVLQIVYKEIAKFSEEERKRLAKLVKELTVLFDKKKPSRWKLPWR